MNDPQIMQMFADVGAIISNGHFVYTSGRHSSVYINKDALYLHTHIISTLCQLMARPYDAGQVDVVVGPVLGGIVLSQWVAHALNASRSSGETLAVYAEKEAEGSDKQFSFRRGYDKYIAGKNVLVVEDVLTTGGSARQVIELVRKHGGNVVGLSVLCNRGGVQPTDVGDVPIHALITVTLETFAEADCLLCQQHVPINTEVGKGKTFLAKGQSSSFVAKLERCWQRDNFVCVGLDSDYARLPATVKSGVSVEEALFIFNRDIVDATHDLVCAYKPNSAFYEAQGDQGFRALTRTVQYIRERYPHIPVILDAKRADIGSTNHGYVAAAFDILGVDAITVHPYLGQDALAPFLARKEKGIIVLVKTSNPGSAELQDLPVGDSGEPLYQVVARHVAHTWNTNGNCALVVGATYPAELTKVRAIVGDIPILIPGIGVQGGKVEVTVSAAKDSRGWGMILNASRDIIFASQERDFAQAARKATEQLRDAINRAR